MGDLATISAMQFSPETILKFLISFRSLPVKIKFVAISRMLEHTQSDNTVCLKGEEQEMKCSLIVHRKLQSTKNKLQIEVVLLLVVW